MKTRKCHGKRLLSAILLFGIALKPCAAFADTAPVPAKLTAPAAAIDVSVTAKITMTAAAGASTMDVSDVTVTNNAAMGTISLDSVAYGVDVDPWTLTLDTENFTAMAKDQHKFSLTADGQDLKAGSKAYDAKQLTPGASYTVAMEGKTGLSTVEVSDVQAGTVVLTVSMVSEGTSEAGGTTRKISIVTAVDVVEEIEVSGKELSPVVGSSGEHMAPECLADYEITKPSRVIFNFYLFNSEQTPHAGIPMPYALNYEIFAGNETNGDTWKSEHTPEYISSDGEFETIDKIITQEEIDNAGGVFLLHVSARAKMYPNVVLSGLEQPYHYSCHVYEL